eukprot:CAMPEP_0201511662 /NCGR_PEP_ID=MMETSP0161_2-20130828/4084_1 /ASSEMBLY_ACC=CAM_ASM_000251 /TAXON_ID=180227 /ORGANISM="Neoparamoeba aestuarina, Strain SoJaBio B1-5/56/2" /LENGTH=171 /DNA_ID=CAMNT_0047907245 /DNA_START=63 /DNA_END=575 /DNA_ORIENTATION=-
MAEPADELFDIFDEHGHHIGIKPRGKVHRDGDWHRSVEVFVVAPKDGKTMMALQKRSAQKVVSPSAWDLSCAEHLEVGEPFYDGAIRGLKEELGLEVGEGKEELALLKGEIKFCLDDEEKGIHDHEMKELYLYRLSDPDLVKPNPVEVDEITWKTVEEVKEMMASTPQLVS